MSDAVDTRARRGKRAPDKHSSQPSGPGSDSAGAADSPGGEAGSGDFSDQELRDLYRALLLPRLIEEKMLRLLRQGKLSKWFSGIGQEAIAVGVVAALEERDIVLPLHRNLGVFTAPRGLGG